MHEDAIALQPQYTRVLVNPYHYNALCIGKALLLLQALCLSAVVLLFGACLVYGITKNLELGTCCATPTAFCTPSVRLRSMLSKPSAQSHI